MPATVDIYRWYNDHVSNIAMSQVITSMLASFYTSNDPVAQQYPTFIDGTRSGGQPRFSYAMATRLHATTSPATLINNIVWYNSGYPSDWTPGCTAQVATTSTFFATPTGTLRVTGASIFSISGFGSVDFSTHPSGTPLTVGGTLANPTTGDFGNFVYMQFNVAPKWLTGSTQSGVTSGTKSPITVTWQYDEA